MQAASQEDVFGLTSIDGTQHLTFILSDHEYALSIARIKEIIEYSEITSVPLVPSFISGVLNLRGNVVPVIDLCKRLDLKTSEITARTCIVIVEVTIENDKTVIGLVVDKVLQVVEIDSSDLRPAPPFGAQIRTDFIENMIQMKDSFIIILNIDQVLSEEEILVINALSEESPLLSDNET